MQDSVSFPKPQLVTEERIKEALAKHEKQKALREALDRQVKESEIRKTDQPAAGHATPRDKAPSRVLPETERDTSTTKAEPPSHYTHTQSPTKQREPRSKVRADKSSAAVASAPPVPPVEPARYTFDFDGGHALFTREPLDEKTPASAANTPRSARRGSGASAVKEMRPKGAAKAPKKSAVAEPRGAPGKTGAPAPPSVPRTRSQPKGKASNGGYDSHSLPVNIEDVLREKGLLPSKPAAGAGKKRILPVPTRTSGTPSHDTQSLPADLVRDLTAAAAQRPQQTPPKTTPQRGSPPVSRPQDLRSPFVSPDKDCHNDGDYLQRRSVTDTFALPMYQDHSDPDITRSSSGSRVHPSSTPNRPRLDDGVLSRELGGKPASSGGLLSPGGGKGRKARGPAGPLSSRPPGGVLPPLERPTSQGSAVGVIEMSALLTPTHSPVPKAPPSQRETSKGLPPSEVERLQKQLRTRSAEMKKMQEKERNWEDQVKRLREELVEAKRRDMNAKQAAAAAGPRPQRAGTAPEQMPTETNDVQTRGNLLRGNNNNNAKNRRAPAAHAGKHVQPASAIPASRKADFSKAKIFSPDSFRPITAPEYTEASGVNPPANAAFDWQGAHHQQQNRRHAPVTSMATPSSRLVQAMQKARKGSAGSSLTRSSVNGELLSSEEMSFKMASLGTRQTTLGLPERSVVEPVGITLDHLLEFAEAGFITRAQSEELWLFFGGTLPVANASLRASDRADVPREYATQAQLSPMEPSIVVEEVTRTVQARRTITTEEDDEDDEDSDDAAEEEEEEDDDEEDDDEEDDDEEEDDEEEEDEEQEDAGAQERDSPVQHPTQIAPIAIAPLRRVSDLVRERHLASPTTPGSAGVLAPSLRRKISRHFTDEPLPDTS